MDRDRDSGKYWCWGDCLVLLSVDMKTNASLDLQTDTNTNRAR